jgi:hypothetical protein
MKINLLPTFAVALILSAFAIPATTYAKGIISATPWVKGKTIAVAKGIDIGVKVIHIDDSQASPNNASSRSATYKIDLHVEGKPALTSLAIALPEELSVSSVEVIDGAGKPIAANASVNGKKIAVAFNSPITSESYLQVRLKEVSTRWNRSNTWLLPVSAKLEGIAEEIPLSLARIQTYGH